MRKRTSPAAGKAGKPGRKSLLRRSREGVNQRSRRGARPGASRKSPGARQQYLAL
jgi:hypothetical protein